MAQPWRWLLLALALPIVSAAGQNEQQPLISTKKPNIVFILTDDQDLHLDSLSYMPYLQKHLVKQGTSYQRHYCVNALCCPSRVNLWTGKAPHNTNVTDVNPPYGGYPKFVSQGFNSAYLPIWLQEAGYNTYYTGKLFNAQSVNNYHSPHAAGWTGSDFLLDPYTYEYLNATFQRNHDPPVSHEGQYSTDLVAEKAFGFLEDGIRDAEKPFFVGIAPMAPHCNVHINELTEGNFTEKSVTMGPPVSAERHKHLFSDVAVPRTPHFNPEEPHSVSWISRLPKQNASNLEYNDDFYRNRLRSLQPVDEMVDGIISRLEKAGVLENTYIFYSTDNGYHIGQHRLQPGKQCAFEEDVNIPLIIRGPGIEEGAVSTAISSHTDLAPTLLKIAGGKLRDDFDGAPMALLERDLVDVAHRQEHVNVEMWGIIMSEGKYEQFVHPNHTYKALRIIGENYSFLYTVWCSGEHELYDLIHDPYEMHNLYASVAVDTLLMGTATRPNDHTIASATETNNNTTSGSSSPPTLKAVISRLDSLLAVLMTCKARQCTHPWEVLHPARNVASLQDALDAEYDAFYEVEQERVHFIQCEKGYIYESEGPHDIKAYTVGEAAVWHEFT